MDDLKSIIECLLFVADSPLGIERFKDILEEADSKKIRTALNSLCREYDEKGSGLILNEIAGGYQIRTRPEYNEYVKRLLQPNPQRLSKAALETLAIIAYKQPIIRSDIEHLRGVDCGGVLRMLMEKKLVRVLGRKEIPGRPLIYATTKHFLEVFELRDLKDLPSPKEIEMVGELPPEKLEAAALQDASVSNADVGNHPAPKEVEPPDDSTPDVPEPPAPEASESADSAPEKNS
ncbi:MAG: SMC-Scp complex subunit ScpB [Deltaproteobacteria bacterium]|nr:SMC-Scp complex subunit ScpB [Deltaproteobacteria bacterium]